MLIWFGATSGAASLDLLEVGGPAGTPAATNPSAVWWNPAGLAVHRGTQVLLEGAPMFGGLEVVRAPPDYGAVVLNAEMEAAGFPSTYDHSGAETFRSFAIVPFMGASSDFGIPGLGLGVAVLVPQGRGAASDARWGPNRFALREGTVSAPRLSVAAAYRVEDAVSFGLSGSILRSTFVSSSDVATYPDLAAAVRDYIPGGQLPPEFQDAWIESPVYGTKLVLGSRGPLTDTAFTFGGGIYVTPDERVGLSVSWNQGVRLDNRGSARLTFRCPPAYDATARATAEDGGLCHSTIPARASVAYDLPSRLHVGVAVEPAPRLRVEVFGAWVGWSVFDDYRVTLEVERDDVEGVNPDAEARTATLMSQPRLQARGARDSFWIGADGKFAVLEHLTLGARVTFDRRAIPTRFVSPNNFDADMVLVQGSAMVPLARGLRMGVSFTQAAAARRRVSGGAFGVDLARASEDSPSYYLANNKVNRVFYPSADGAYSMRMERLGVSLQASFGSADRR